MNLRGFGVVSPEMIFGRLGFRFMDLEFFNNQRVLNGEIKGFGEGGGGI